MIPKLTRPGAVGVTASLRRALLVLLTLGLILANGSAYVLAQPPTLAHYFYGTATLGGLAAPEGTSVVAKVLSRNLEFSTTVDALGRYGYGADTLQVFGASAGDAITFYLGGAVAQLYDVAGARWLDTYPFTSDPFGAVTELNLAATTHVITATAGLGGAIDPVGTVSVVDGADQGFAIAADPCYEIADVLVDGESVGPVEEYTFTNVVEDHTIEASFELGQFTITATAGEGGSITPSGLVVVDCGADQTFSITPETCYTIADVLVDGESVGPVEEYTFTNVVEDHTIEASFEPTSILMFAPAIQWSTSFRNWGPQNRYPRLVGDVNGDGKADAVGFNPGSGVRVALSTGASFAATSQWSAEFGWLGDNYNHRELADVNGDGQADIVGFLYGDGIYVALSTGSGFGPATKWSTSFRNWGPQNRYPRLVGDVNGDGKADAVGFCPDSGVRVALSTGASFAATSQWSTEFGWLSGSYNHRELADVNGDGKADIVGFLYGDGVYVALSTGSGFGPATKWLDGFQTWGPQATYPRLTGDVNGDGKADIVAFDPAEGAFVALSTGSAFEAPLQGTTDFAWADDNYNHRELGDVDGDGRVDIVGYWYGQGIYVALSQ